jgi:hypothetical protein
MLHRRSLLLTVPLAMALVATVAPHATAAARPDVPVTVHMPVRTVETPGRNGHNGTILMRLGDSRPIRVIVDTGFSGLLIFPNAWGRTPDGVTIKPQRGSFRIPHGPTVGTLTGTAVMSFSGVSTTSALPFEYAQRTNRYLERWEDLGVYGLLGVGAAGGGSMTNPLTALPGTLGRHWSIHFDRAGPNGALVLGAFPPTSSRMTFPLRYIGENSVGAPLWNDRAANGCWTFAGRPPICVRTWFDAAFTLMRVSGTPFSGLPVDSDGYLASGTRVTLSAPGAAFVGHRFVAGQRASRNLVQISPTGNPTINTGNSFYFDYVLTYDLTLGRISLSDQPSSDQPSSEPSERSANR